MNETSKSGPRIALALGSGGARGLAHIGVIEVIESHGFEIVAIAGTSMGALVGGIHAAGRLREYRDWALALERSGVVRLLDFAFGHPGLIKGERVIGVMRELVGSHLIEDLPIEYTAVATDLNAQREVWLNEGPLFDAIRASIAIPMLFTPQIVGGRELVDGGLVAPVPVAPMRQVRADVVIAVDVNSSPAPGLAALSRRIISPTPTELAPVSAPDPSLTARIAQMFEGMMEKREPGPAQPGLIDLMSRSLDTMQAKISRLQLALDPPDLLVQVSRDVCMFHEYWRAAEVIEAGREATKRALASVGISEPSES